MRMSTAVRGAGAGVALAGMAAASAAPAAAHTGPVSPDELWTAWTFDAWVALPLAAALLTYAAGLRRVWSHAGYGRGVRVWQARCFGAGALVLAAALVSPIDGLGGSLFAAHMTQHVLLIGVAAPLLVLGAPVTAALWALSPAARRRVAGAIASTPVRRAGRWLAAPAIAWLLHGAAIWVWHAPALYSAAVVSEAVHAAQHASFVGTAILFWWVLRDRTRHGLAVIYLFTTAVHSSLLGALLAFSPAAFYEPYAATAPAWGFSALEDQQLGGFIMWVPAGLVYFAAALALLASWLRRSDERARRALRLGTQTALPLLAVLLLSGCDRAEAEPRGVFGGDPDRGRAVVPAYGCGACHLIPGVRGADGRVGPALDDVARRVYIAGYLPNEPENLIRWIMDPQEFRDPTAMPDLGVTEQDARDIAAYLYSIR